MNKSIIKKALGLMALVSLSASVFVGCGSKSTGNSSSNQGEHKKIQVYTSFYAMYDFTKKVGGDKINVTNLVPSGTEPHDWEPSTTDVANLEKADVLVYSGAGMEHWIDKVSKTLKNEKLIKVEASKEVKLMDNPEKDEADLKYDPHVWLYPMNAKKEMEAIKEALVKADPSNKDYYESNYEENTKKLDDLDKEFKDTTSKFKKKDIVVAHQAFGYICAAYGLNQVPIEGLQADAEPTAAKMAEIAEFAKKNDVKYIFYEDLISPKVSQAIAKEIGAKTEVLNPLEGLDDEDIKAGKEYFSVMRDNLEMLKKALE